MSDEIADETLDYVLTFTTAHEGDTPFMYNNWPLKNPVVDVTAGVGLAVTSEGHAASPEIRGMFRRRAGDSPASEDDLRQEYRRVAGIARTATNLFSAYRDPSPLYIPRDVMLQALRTKMLQFWQQRGQEFSNLAAVPAQAQAALMSYNYGLRLKAAPRMCAAVRSGDYATAAMESFIAGWDGQKNEAHRVLFSNAATIVRLGLALGELPPIQGPFKPPPSIGTNSELVGTWAVTIGDWSGVFVFAADGTASWSDDDETHWGSWSADGAHAEWSFDDPGDIRTFRVPLPIDPAGAAGTILPEGQGAFVMAKVAG